MKRFCVKAISSIRFWCELKNLFNNLLEGCILMPRVWKLKGKGGADHSLRSYDYFIKHNCAACGWSFEPTKRTKPIKTLDDYKQFFEDHANGHAWNRQGIHTLFDRVKAGDFLWTCRKNGMYYVARVPAEPKELFHFDPSGDAYDHDCVPQLRKIEWKEVGTEETVPGSVSTYTANRQSIFQVDKQEDKINESEYTATGLFSALQLDEEEYYLEKLTLSKSDLWRFLNYQSVEDLVSLWLYDQYNYVTIPSTSKMSTANYEFVLIDGTIHNSARSSKRIYIQVKNGNVDLDPVCYKDLLSRNNHEVWLITTGGQITIDKKQKASIVCCRRDETAKSGYSTKAFKISNLLDFAFDERVSPILPTPIAIWVKFINDHANPSSD